VDLLELLGCSYPIDTADDDNDESVNPSPQVSPRSLITYPLSLITYHSSLITCLPQVSPRSPEGADRVASRRGCGEDEADGGGGQEPASDDAVHLEIAGSGFGCPLPTPPRRRRGAARQGRAGGEGAEEGGASTGCLSSARARLGSRGWWEAMRSMLRQRAGKRESTCVVVSGSAFGSSPEQHSGEGGGDELMGMHGPSQDSQTFVRLLRYGNSSC